QHGVAIIPGIEISAYDYDRNRRAHILGYYVEPKHPALAAVCDPLVAQRGQASRRMVTTLIEHGYDITWEQVERYAAGGSCVFKQHIMHALMDSGYCSELFGDLYRQLFSRSGEDDRPGIAYIPLRYADARQAIQAIRAAGGV